MGMTENISKVVKFGSIIFLCNNRSKKFMRGMIFGFLMGLVQIGSEDFFFLGGGGWLFVFFGFSSFEDKGNDYYLQ